MIDGITIPSKTETLCTLEAISALLDGYRLEHPSTANRSFYGDTSNRETPISEIKKKEVGMITYSVKEFYDKYHRLADLWYIPIDIPDQPTNPGFSAVASAIAKVYDLPLEETKP